MPESLGIRLRRRREAQHVELATIAQRTKIKLSLLDALERDDVSQWPAGIFRRAYVRAYADAIGLDPDAVVREFLEAHPDPVEASEADLAADAANAAKGQGRPATRLRNIVGSAFGSFSRIARGTTARERVLVPGAAVTANASVTAAVTSERPTPPAPPPPASESAAERDAEEPSTVPESAPDRVPAPDPPPRRPNGPDLLEVARICTELGRVQTGSEVSPLLDDAARIMEARGLIVWIWDPPADQLRPAVASGYSDKVLAQLPALPSGSDNATAAAFRTGRTRIIGGDEHSSGALAVPLLTPAGCAGVLTVELPNGSERSEAVRAVAMILAAALAPLTGSTQDVEASSDAEAAMHAR